MLDVDESIFPHNIVKWTALAMEGIDAEIAVMRRPLRNTDPMQSIGVSALGWMPDESSVEMQGIGHPAPQMPTLQTYTLALQAFVKDTEEERGLATHSHLAQRARMVLYTDPNLRVIFRDLSATLAGGLQESMRRWGVSTARYFSGEIDSQMLYLSTLEFWVQTETRLPN